MSSSGTSKPYRRRAEGKPIVSDVVCLDCQDTGLRDSGGTYPWGEPAYVPCDCTPLQLAARALLRAMKNERLSWYRAANAMVEQMEREGRTSFNSLEQRRLAAALEELAKA
jgi:hypothetical protein